MSEKITKELLLLWNSCAEGYRRFCKLFAAGATLPMCRQKGHSPSVTVIGYRNSGDWNSGNRNSGHWNSGNWNSGDWNSGNRNSGNRNSGDWNSGNRNSGDWNSGYWNSGNRNSGHFNCDTPATIRVFGKECRIQDWDNAYKPSFLYFQLTEWISSKNMTEAEKITHPLHETAGGFIRVYTYQDAFKRSWERADPADRIKVKDLPNFDAEIFFKISGIDLREP